MTSFLFLTGDILAVNCSAHGDQTLQVTWSREYAELPDRRATVRTDGTLIISQIVPEDSGKYFCSARSVGGAVQATSVMNLIVVKSKSLLMNSKLPVHTDTYSRLGPRQIKYFLTGSSSLGAGNCLFHFSDLGVFGFMNSLVFQV